MKTVGEYAPFANSMREDRGRDLKKPRNCPKGRGHLFLFRGGESREALGKVERLHEKPRSTNPTNSSGRKNRIMEKRTLCVGIKAL